MAETQMVATVLQSQLKSEEDEEEESWQSKDSNMGGWEDKMTLAQFSQSKQSSSPKAILPLNTVVADNINKSKSCKKVSFADLDETKSSSTDSGRVDSLSAVERAEEVQSRLGTEFPSFVKRMLKSHVTGGFWLGLPISFCNSNLPKSDSPITLVDENGEESVTKFLAEKNGLSGGWRGFSMAHKLVEEDVLVFQLVKATKFKVYIVRTHCLAEVDGALGLLQLEACRKLNDGKAIKKFRKHTCTRSLTQSKKHKTSPPISDSDLGLTAGQHSENDSDEVDSEVLEGIRFSGSMVDFKDMKNLESFTVMVNGLVIDSEIPEHLRTKYYELCRSQNAFLHEHLLEGFNCKLVAGIISETVNIADAIRASKLSTAHDEFSIWDKSLQAFEQLGMNVAFLRSRLKQIMNLAFESEQAVDSKRYSEAITGQARVQEEIKTLEDNLVELRNESQRFETDIKTLKMDAEKHELMFQAMVNKSW